MKLREGTLINRSQIHYTETSSTGYNILLRLTEWLATRDVDILNRIVIYVQVWGDQSSDVSTGDSLTIRCKSYGRDWFRVITGFSAQLANYTIVEPIEFNMSYPNMVNPATPLDTTLSVKCTDWLITETHHYLFEIQAYLIDVPTDVFVRTF